MLFRSTFKVLLPASNNFFIKIIKLIKRTLKVKKIKKEKHLDVVISFTENANLVNILSKGKEHIITSERNLPFFHYKRKFKIKYICKKTDKIIALSKLVEKDLVDNFDVDPKKVITIYNSCNRESLEKSSNELEKIKNKLSKNKRYIITMGRLNYQKGQWHLIKAFKKVKDKIPNVELLILGQGELEEELKELTNKMKLNDSVKFLGYIKNPHSILKYCDVFVFSSIVEGLGNVLLEALTFDKAIVSTDCDAGPREILAPNTEIDKKTDVIEYAEYGILTPTFSKEKFNKDDISINREENCLSNAIIEILENDELRLKYEKNAKNRMEDFKPDKIKQQWIDLIENLGEEDGEKK